ncbi:ClpP/crotonase-like domain-containing protein [Amylostereum chailletii]|nr:ClpP/crotonase-like domain-containing protein [Amylostereum chailletii]
MASVTFPLNSSEPLLTLTRPSPYLWQLEFHNGQDNRLTRSLLVDAFAPALNLVEKEWRVKYQAAKVATKAGQQTDPNAGSGALVLVGKIDQDKFFSNGFDLPSVIEDPLWFPVTFDPIIVRLLTFPIPTVAAINGHCFAAGVLLSLACDYRVMIDGSKRRAWMCMNEVDFGANLPPSFVGIIKAKVGKPLVFRKMALEGHRFTPPEALEAGLIDVIGGSDTSSVLKDALTLANGKASKAKLGVWGLIKSEIYRDFIQMTRRDIQPWNTESDAAAARHRLSKL